MPAAALPLLYSFRRCPYAMRARMGLLASGQACVVREVRLRDKPAALLEASPKGTVPVLVLPDGQVLAESLDILRWALAQHDPLAWWPQGDAALQDALALIAQNDGPFKRRLDRYKYPNRYQLPDGLAQRDAAADFLQSLQDRLQTQPFLHGAHWGLADTAIAPFVRQFAHTDAVWFGAQSWPQLQLWLAAFEASDLFAQVMQAYSVWLPGQPEARFPPPLHP